MCPSPVKSKLLALLETLDIMKIRTLLSVVAMVGLSACGGGDDNDSNAKPLVIAHRGASGYLPEHTLGGYELAVRLGADYIEPDLQLSKDGVLVAMHDDTLDRTTNISTLFSTRNNAYKVSDFTLSEIKTLTVLPTGTGKASYPGFTPSATDPWRVPTFQEVVAFAKSASQNAGRTVGIYPEAKQADPVMEDGILLTLSQNGYNAQSRVFIQSFSDLTLRSMRTKEAAQGNPMPQMLLGGAVTAADGTARVGVLGASAAATTTLTLKDVASFAEGIAVVVNFDTFSVTKKFIDQAHAAGLKVHGWTFAQPDTTLAAAEYRKYLEMGMDGMFTNYTDLAVKARDAYVQGK